MNRLKFPALTGNKNISACSRNRIFILRWHASNNRLYFKHYFSAITRVYSREISEKQTLIFVVLSDRLQLIKQGWYLLVGFIRWKRAQWSKSKFKASTKHQPVSSPFFRTDRSLAKFRTNLSVKKKGKTNIEIDRSFRSIFGCMPRVSHRRSEGWKFVQRCDKNERELLRNINWINKPFTLPFLFFFFFEVYGIFTFFVLKCFVPILYYSTNLPFFFLNVRYEWTFYLIKIVSRNIWFDTLRFPRD